MLGKVFGVAFFVYLFFGFMLLPCLNTHHAASSPRRTAAGNIDPLRGHPLLLRGQHGQATSWNSLKLAVCLVITVNVVGVSASCC